MINYKEKLTTHRELYPSKDIETTVESDRGRIFSSAAFRRLQKRTQVFALEMKYSPTQGYEVSCYKSNFS